MIYCINGGFRESSILIPNKGNREQCEELVHLSFILETFFLFFHTTALYYYIPKDIYIIYGRRRYNYYTYWPREITIALT